MYVGVGWVIIEYSVHSGKKILISLINGRRTGRYVQGYVEQSYIDRHGSIEEKIVYKKNPKNWPYRAETQGPYSGIITCGHDPIMFAHNCHKMKLKDGILTYTYKTLKGQKDDFRGIFEDITSTIDVRPEH